MSQNKKIILAAGIIIVVGLAVFYGIKAGWWVKLNVPFLNNIASPTDTSDSENSAFPTRQDAPKNVEVPEPGSSGQSADIAVPEISVEAAPGVAAKLRIFNIAASGGKYSPSTIIVRTGDTVHINFTAEDDTYDIVFPDYGLRQQAKKGETKVIEFGATIDGQFAFHCENACPNGKAQGTLIVTP